jgi:hypothetical protein
MINEDQTGYAPVEGDIPNMHEDAIGVSWPECFGTVYKVPAVRIRKPIKGVLQENFNINSTTVKITNGEKFTQNEAIDIIIDRILCTGSFNGDVFTFTEINKPYYSSISFAARPPADEHVNNSHVAWVTDSSINLVGKYCYSINFLSEYMVNYCINQDGTKCFFAKPWRPARGYEDILMDATFSMIEVCGEPHTNWLETFLIHCDYYWVGAAVGGWVLHYYYPKDEYTIDSWEIETGADVIIDNSYTDIYVCNLLASTDIFGVYGYRTDKDNKRILAVIPSRYYTKNLTNSILKVGITCTTLEFDVPLEEYTHENWEGDIYVSLVSNQGYNTADIIKYLFDEYTDLDTDAASFTTVQTQLANYPSCFALLEQYDVLEICEKIAWQARCAIYISSETVYIRYLCAGRPEDGEHDFSINDSNIQFKSLQLGFTPSENLVTKLIANWRLDYSPEENSSKTFIYEKNISDYGLLESNENFFIYNIENLVQLSAAFWGYRYSNVWRQASFKIFLQHLDVEIFDIISSRVPATSHNELIGIVKQLSYDSDNKNINISAELGSRMTDISASDSQPDMDSYIFESTIYYPYFHGEENYLINGNNMPDLSYGNMEENYIIEKIFDYNYLNADPPFVKGPNVVMGSNRLDEYRDELEYLSKGILVKNVSGIEIPAYKAIEIVSTVPVDGAIEVTRPTVDNLPASRLLTSGAYAIAAGKTGLANPLYGNKDIAKADCDGTFVVDDEIGSQEDSFNLIKGKSGVKVSGKDGTKAIIRPKASPQISIGKIKSGTGDTYIVTQYPDGPDEAAGDDITVTQLQIDAGETIPVDTWVFILKIGTNYYMQVPVWLA